MAEFEHGNFRVKGDVVDIYPSYADTAFRIPEHTVYIEIAPIGATAKGFPTANPARKTSNEQSTNQPAWHDEKTWLYKD